MQVRVGCEFVHHVAMPTHAVLHVEPRLGAQTSVLAERWDNDPQLAAERFVDGFGNLCRRLTIPAGVSTLRYHCTVDVSPDQDPYAPDAPEVPPPELPPEVLEFTLPSRFCPSDELGTQAWELFGSIPPGWGRVQAIHDWVHGAVTFGYGSSSPLTTAAEVLASGKGVCRDYAHLAVTFCRALNIPARYAFGYLPDIDVPTPHDPMDFCAWTEVWLGDRWWTFDPRNNVRRIGRVLIGVGRDALDVAMVTTFGPADLRSMTVWAEEVAA